MEYSIEYFDSLIGKIERLEKLKNIDTEHELKNYQTYLENYRKRLLDSNILYIKDKKYFFTDKILLAYEFLNDHYNEAQIIMEEDINE